MAKNRSKLGSQDIEMKLMEAERSVGELENQLSMLETQLEASETKRYVIEDKLSTLQKKLMDTEDLASSLAHDKVAAEGRACGRRS